MTSPNYWELPEQWLTEEDDNDIPELEPEEPYEVQPDEMERL